MRWLQSQASELKRSRSELVPGGFFVLGQFVSPVQALEILKSGSIVLAVAKTAPAELWRVRNDRSRMACRATKAGDTSPPSLAARNCKDQVLPDIGHIFARGVG